MEAQLFPKRDGDTHTVRHLQFSSTIDVEDELQKPSLVRQRRQAILIVEYVQKQLSNPVIFELISAHGSRGFQDLTNVIQSELAKY